MINEEQQALVDKVVEEGKKKGYVAVKKILDIADEDSEDFNEITKRLEDLNIDIVSDDDDLESCEEDEDGDLDKLVDDFDGFIGELEGDTEFNEFSSEIENDLKTKDIDDIVSSIGTPSQADDPIKMYLKEIGQIPLLSTNRELELSRTVQQGLIAEDILNMVLKGKKEMSEEEQAKLRACVEEGQDARVILIESNLRLVVSIAKRYLGRGMQLQDLIQEGNMGLMKAVNKFDPTKGFKFSTYATWWIRQAITRAIADQARTIRIPVHMVETINKFIRAQRQLLQDLGREATPEELSEYMKLPLDKVREIQKISQEPVSLETPIGEEEDSHLGDFIQDDNMPVPAEAATFTLLREQLYGVLETLGEREQKVLMLRFGLEDGKARTLEEVGKEFNVTRERIRQIEAKALRKLRHPSRSRKLKDY